MSIIPQVMNTLFSAVQNKDEIKNHLVEGEITMGLANFFKDKFEKKNCALCGNECSMMRRTKIRNDNYICDECGNKCSKYVRLSEFDLDEVKGHIEYMERQNRLFKEVYSKEVKKENIPPLLEEDGIEFCDALGMFRIRHKNDDGRGKLIELFRYDQVAGYEEYIKETPAGEPDHKPEFEECGMIIKLLGGNMIGINTENKMGLRPHPYIKRELKICFSKKERSALKYAGYAKDKFDYIFGVHDDESSLFGFCRTKAEKREDAAAVGMAAALGMAFKAAKSGVESVSGEEKAKLEEHMKAIDDAATDGLAVYTRRADEAEAKIT